MFIEADEFDDYPEGAIVRFKATDEPETTSQPWDEIAERHGLRNRLVARIASYRDAMQADPNMDEATRTYYEEEIQFKEHQIARIDAGDNLLSHGFYAQVFGQPDFIQNEIYPVHENRCAMNLITLNTGWGDCGNINLLFNVDEQGVPCALWFEASCA